ncbi:hypothetical protein AZ78_1883 [Lysobacter capsici AZ78]|uniref:Uncharacterized protein n=1 Tax=Lysobacter capsici AZ78 TaxID=1444315 RepID=A0A108U889_9GAMM|nr:hypothetical protein AZ78_1883 [Lysobacter capsici AZ78]
MPEASLPRPIFCGTQLQPRRFSFSTTSAFKTAPQPERSVGAEAPPTKGFVAARRNHSPAYRTPVNTHAARFWNNHRLKPPRAGSAP